MFNVSPAFLTAVRGSHEIASSVQIIQPGQTGVSFEGRFLNIVEGQVTLDATADIRGSLDLTIVEPWSSGTTTFDVAPYGTELFVTRGIVFGNGSVQRVPLGIYRIVTVEQESAPKGTLRVTGQDRMQGIIEAKLEAAVSIPGSNTFGAVVNAMVLGGTISGQVVPGVYPTATIIWLNADGSVDATTPTQVINRDGVVAEQDRFGFLDDLTKSLNKIWYWDYKGALIIKPIPTNTVPVFEVDSGHDGVLVSAHRTQTREGIYNSVVASGESPDQLAPPSAVVRDTNPTSPTFYGGPFGKVPYFYTSSNIQSVASGTSNGNNATDVATALLAQFKGLPYDVDFTMVPNPALEPYDAIRITYPVDLTQQPHVKQESHNLSQVVIGLGVNTAMACGTKLISTNAA